MLQANVKLDIEELSERTYSFSNSLESDGTLEFIQADQSEVTTTTSEDTIASPSEPSHTLTPDSMSPSTINEPTIVIEVHHDNLTVHLQVCTSHPLK